MRFATPLRLPARMGVAAVLLVAAAASGQGPPFSVRPEVISSGGGEAGGSQFLAVTTAGEPAVGSATGPQFRLEAGFHAAAGSRATSAGAPVAGLPRQLALDQNRPNPFRGRTTIPFALPRPARVRLTVVDVRGRVVATLLDEERAAGFHRVELSAGRLAAGVYWYRLEAPGFERTKKLVVLH